MSQEIADFIVVGSGPTGAMTAQTLVEGGAQVVMLDVGVTSKNNQAPVPNKDFITIRRSENEQYRYFIGESAEGTIVEDMGKGAQITPARQHMLALTHQYLPSQSKNFSAVESLGYGGLGIGWGLGCWEWSAAELSAAGLDTKTIQAAYKIIARRIGISATKDDAQAYTLGNLDHYQPSPTMDRNAHLLYGKYQKNKKALARRGFVMGRAPLALLTQNLGQRKAYQYRDLDYYADKDHSAWRPWMTIDTLKKQGNFHYIPNQLVLTFTEHKNHVTVHCLDIVTGTKTKYHGKKLILASGVLGTARIVLRTLGQTTVKLPLLCNPYTLIPCVQPALFGKGVEPRKTGFAQLSLFLDEKQQNFGAAMASIYSYQSLMLFRIIKRVPFNFVDARLITRYLMPGIIIMGIHHPDTPSKSKYVMLKADKTSPTGDALHTHYVQSNEAKAQQRARETTYMRAMRRLGAHPIKRIDPGHGASIHYAGTLPVSHTAKPYTTSPDGRLYGTKRVYIADGSSFTYLPAKGLTFTLMANAHRVAENARQ